MKFLVIALVVLFFMVVSFSHVSYADDNPIEWEHGWKTNDVAATRYLKPAEVQEISEGGHITIPPFYYIGFSYSQNPGNCDRSELSDFMERENGIAFKFGGYPGAEMFVAFRDVKDKESANKKLKGILPALSKLIRSLH